MTIELILFTMSVALNVVLILIIRCLNTQDYSGELQIDDEKEIVQVAFYGQKDLHEVVHNKDVVSFKVIRKPIEYDIPVAQEKHGV